MQSNDLNHFFSQVKDATFCFFIEYPLNLKTDTEELVFEIGSYRLSINELNHQQIVLVVCKEEFVPSTTQFLTLAQLFRSIPPTLSVVYFGLGCALYDQLHRGNWVAVCDQINFDSMPWLHEFITSQNISQTSRQGDFFDQAIISEFNNAGSLCGIDLKLVSSMYFPIWWNLTPAEIKVAGICQAEIISSRLTIMSCLAHYLGLTFSGFVCCIFTADKHGRMIRPRYDEEDYQFFSQQVFRLINSFLGLTANDQCTEEILFLLTTNQEQ